MSIEVGRNDRAGDVELAEQGETPVEPLPPPSVSMARRRRHWLLIAALAGVLMVALAAGAYVANLSLSQTYSPQRAVADYFAAQQRADVNSMWSLASYERGDGSYERMFNQAALRAMMQLPANAKLRDVRITSTRQLDSVSRLMGVSLTWNGVPRHLTLTVRKDPRGSHWFFYPSWKVEIPASTVNVALPNQAGTILIDGVYPPPGTAQTSVKVMPGFHEVAMLDTPLLDGASQQVDAVRDAAVSVPGTISKSATAKAGDAVKYGFSHCTTSDNCFDHTYSAPNTNFNYYMPLPGYGDIFYTKYLITLTGDPTATMKLTLQVDKGTVSVSGPCTSTYTINGSRQYTLKGDFSGTLTWNGGGFDSEMSWNCWSAKG